MCGYVTACQAICFTTWGSLCKYFPLVAAPPKSAINKIVQDSGAPDQIVALRTRLWRGEIVAGTNHRHSDTQASLSNLADGWGPSDGWAPLFLVKCRERCRYFCIDHRVINHRLSCEIYSPRAGRFGSK